MVDGLGPTARSPARPGRSSFSRPRCKPAAPFGGQAGALPAKSVERANEKNRSVVWGRRQGKRSCQQEPARKGARACARSTKRSIQPEKQERKRGVRQG